MRMESGTRVLECQNGTARTGHRLYLNISKVAN